MYEIKEEHRYVVDRVGHFLEQLKKATDPLEIEALVYTIMRTTEASYRRLHLTNGGTEERMP